MSLAYLFPCRWFRCDYTLSIWVSSTFVYFIPTYVFPLRLLWLPVINLHHCIRFFFLLNFISPPIGGGVWRSLRLDLVWSIWKDDRIGEFSLIRGALCSFLPLTLPLFSLDHLASRFFVPHPKHLLTVHSCTVFSLLLIISSAAQEHRSISSWSFLFYCSCVSPT